MGTQVHVSDALYRELDELPTLSKSQADDLKIGSDEHGLSMGTLPGDGWRLWLHRPTSGIVEGEIREGGKWTDADEQEVGEMLRLAQQVGLIFYRG